VTTAFVGWASEGSIPTGSVVKRTVENSYDWLYVLDGGVAEHHIGQCLAREAVGDLRDVDKLGAVAESGLLQLP
jgi:hypothetical protein